MEMKKQYSANERVWQTLLYNDNNIEKYIEDLNRVVKYWKDGDGIYSKSEIIDMLNCTHTTFTKRIDDIWIADKITTKQWEKIQALAFKEYRKAVHSL